LGTLAGNIVSAQPAADGSLALTALGASLTVIGHGYERQIGIANAFAGPGVSKIDATKEVLTRITIPINGERRGSSYQRLAMRRSLSLPMVAAAAVVRLEKNRFERVRLAVGPMAPTPLLVSEIDDLLWGKSVSHGNISKAVEILGMVAQPRDSLLRGSRDYRLSMVQVLACKAIMAASMKARRQE
jgi:carbon-monoxide dehydrogenase medium subunit